MSDTYRPEDILPVANPVAVAAAMAVLDDHFAALNARDEAALVATLHFPHYRLSSGVMPSGNVRTATSRTSTLGLVRPGTTVRGTFAT